METQVYTVIYEAEANITEAIVLYLESLKEEHKELPQDHIWQGRVQVAV